MVPYLLSYTVGRMHAVAKNSWIAEKEWERTVIREIVAGKALRILNSKAKNQPKNENTQTKGAAIVMVDARQTFWQFSAFMASRRVHCDLLKKQHTPSNENKMCRATRTHHLENSISVHFFPFAFHHNRSVHSREESIYRFLAFFMGIEYECRV